MYQILKKNKLISLHIMVVFLGFTGVLGKLISLATPYLVWHRMLIAFVALFIFLLIKKQIHSIPKKDILPLMGIGAIVAFHWFFFFGAIKVSNISVAVICMATASLFSAFLEPIFFKRKLLKYELLFGIIVLIALSYMLYEKPENKEINYVLGYAYGIASAFLGTLFTMFNGKYINKLDADESPISLLGGVGICIIKSCFNIKCQII